MLRGVVQTNKQINSQNEPYKYLIKGEMRSTQTREGKLKQNLNKQSNTTKNVLN